jgi:hypothetical protein
VSDSASVIVPFVGSIANYRFGTQIQGTTYIFDVYWNSRDAAWYFHVRDISETMIQAGIKIVLGAYLGRRSNDPLFRDGVFVAVDLANKGQEAGFDDLGSRVLVQYIPAEELMVRLSKIVR